MDEFLAEQLFRLGSMMLASDSGSLDKVNVNAAAAANRHSKLEVSNNETPQIRLSTVKCCERVSERRL